jgi:hypothetical protein
MRGGPNALFFGASWLLEEALDPAMDVESVDAARVSDALAVAVRDERVHCQDDIRTGV